MPPLPAEACPRWERCGAAVCPALPDWQRVRHTTDDRVCLYLTELAKPGGAARVAAALGAAAGALLAPLQAAHAALAAPGAPATGPGHGVLAGVLARAAATGSRLAAGARLRRPTGT